MGANKQKIYIYTGVVFLAQLCLCISFNIVGPLLSDIMQHYAIELDGGGLMTLFQNIGGTLAIILLAIIMDKLNKPATFIAPLLLMAASMLLIGIVPPYAVFMLMFLFFGISISTMDMVGNAIIPDIHSEKRNAALSLLHGIAPIGAVISPVFAGTIVASGMPWYNVYTIVGCLILLVSVVYAIVYLSARKSLKVIRIQHTAKKEKGIFKKFIMDKRVLTAMGCVFIFAGFQSGIIVWVSKYFLDVFRCGTVAAGLGLSAYWLGTSIIRVLFGITPLRNLYIRRVIIYGSISSGIVLAIGIISRNYYLMLACVFFSGCLNAPVLPHSIGMLSGWYAKYSGLASSAVFASLYLAFSLSPLLMGAIAYRWGMHVMMFVPAICTFLAGFIAILLPKEKMIR
ncbi:MAG: MFS transporter [Christensenellales bacterium]|jgi:MFS family permease